MAKTEALKIKQKRALRVLRELRNLYPHAKCSLDFRNPFELVCATILSAQCTDARVNLVTPKLFNRFPSASEMSAGDLKEIEALIQSTGFYKNKAKALKEMSFQLCEKHNGEVPQTLEELFALRGVGRKTANVVLGNAFGIPGLVVDTHVGRLVRRLGFTTETDPVKVEFAMQKIIPKKDWSIFSHYLVFHGRAVCDARRPRCAECTLLKECPQEMVTQKTGTPRLVNRLAKKK